MDNDFLDNKILDYDNHIAIMSMYREEWRHRDQLFISNFWKFTYLSLVITFLPNFLERWTQGGNFGQVVSLPKGVFSAAGILSSIWGLYLGLAENERITFLDETYRLLEKKLPEIYHVKKIKHKLFKRRLNKTLCIVIYIGIMLLAVINIRYPLLN